MTVSDERSSTIKNWADEFDELDFGVMEKNLRAVFWRWTPKPEAPARIPQIKKTGEDRPAEEKA